MVSLGVIPFEFPQHLFIVKTRGFGQPSGENCMIVGVHWWNYTSKWETDGWTDGIISTQCPRKKHVTTVISQGKAVALDRWGGNETIFRWCIDWLLTTPKSVAIRHLLLKLF